MRVTNYDLTRRVAARDAAIDKLKKELNEQKRVNEILIASGQIKPETIKAARELVKTIEL